VAPLVADGASRLVYPLFALVANGIYSDGIISYLSVSFGFVPVCASLIALGIIPQILPQLSVDYDKGLDISVVAVVVSLVVTSILCASLGSLWLITGNSIYIRITLILAVSFLDCLYWIGIFIGMRSEYIKTTLLICCLRSLPVIFLIPQTRNLQYSNALFTAAMIISLLIAPVLSILSSRLFRTGLDNFIDKIQTLFKFYLGVRLTNNLGFLLAGTIFPLSVALSRNTSSENLDPNTFVNAQAISSFSYPFLALSTAVPLILTRLLAVRRPKAAQLFRTFLIISLVSGLASYFFVDRVTLADNLYLKLPIRQSIVILSAVSVGCANFYPLISYVLCIRGRSKIVSVCHVGSAIASYFLFCSWFYSSAQGMQAQLLMYYAFCIASMLTVLLVQGRNSAHNA
jgi:hypothetical protein